MIVRPATIDDVPEIARIYNYYVAESTSTFQTEEDSNDDRARWLVNHGERYPVLIAEHEERIVGWGSLSPFHPRSSAWHTVEDSVYVDEGCRGKGVGTAILKDLVDRAKEIGYHSVVAGIAADQPASIALHAKLGFVEVSRIKEVGHKLGVWIDVIQMQKML